MSNCCAPNPNPNPDPNPNPNPNPDPSPTPDPTPTPTQDYPQLKKAEQKVSVADMKVGGSGSMRAMDGKVVEQETIKARYVVNAAGGQPEP